MSAPKRASIQHSNEDVYAQLKESWKHWVGTFALKDFKKGNQLLRQSQEY